MLLRALEVMYLPPWDQDAQCLKHITRFVQGLLTFAWRCDSVMKNMQSVCPLCVTNFMS